MKEVIYHICTVKDNSITPIIKITEKEKDDLEWACKTLYEFDKQFMVYSSFKINLKEFKQFHNKGLNIPANKLNIRALLSNGVKFEINRKTIALLGSFSFFIDNAKSNGSKDNKKLLKSYIEKIKGENFSFRFLWATRNIAMHQGFVINSPSFISGNYSYYISKSLFSKPDRGIDAKLYNEISDLPEDIIDIVPLLYDLELYVNKIQGYILYLKEQELLHAIAIIDDALGHVKEDDNELLISTENDESTKIQGGIISFLASENKPIIGKLLNSHRNEYKNFIINA